YGRLSSVLLRTAVGHSFARRRYGEGKRDDRDQQWQPWLIPRDRSNRFRDGLRHVAPGARGLFRLWALLPRRAVGTGRLVRAGGGAARALRRGPCGDTVHTGRGPYGRVWLGPRRSRLRGSRLRGS